MDSKIASHYKNISIAVAFLDSGSCRLISETAYKIGFNLSILHWAIFLNLALIALYSFTPREFTRIQRQIAVCLVLIICYILLIGAFRGYGSAQAISREIIEAIFLLIIITNSKFNIVRLGNFVVLTGFTFSVLSLILYWGYFFGLISIKPVIISNGQIYFEGFGGYLNNAYHSDVLNFGSLYRSQSYWSEASPFAQFLQVPLFISLQKVVSNKEKVVNVVICATIAFALIMTFSMVNFFALIVTLSIFFLWVHKKNVHYSGLRRVFSLILVLLLLFSGYSLYKITTIEMGRKADRGNVLFKGTGGYTTRIDRFTTTMGVFDESFFGDRAYAYKHRLAGDNAGTIAGIVLIGGFPLLLLAGYIYSKFLISIFKIMRKTKYVILYLGSISFFVAFMLYGAFHEVYCFFLFALFTTYIKRDLAEREII